MAAFTAAENVETVCVVKPCGDAMSLSVTLGAGPICARPVRHLGLAPLRFTCDHDGDRS